MTDEFIMINKGRMVRRGQCDAHARCCYCRYQNGNELEIDEDVKWSVVESLQLESIRQPCRTPETWSACRHQDEAAPFLFVA
jgi:hypothetical protein